MGRPRAANTHLPKYVSINNGAYWYKPPQSKAVRMCRPDGESIPLTDEAGMYLWLSRQTAKAATGPLGTLGAVFDRYLRDVLPTLAPRTQKDYVRHIKVLRAWCGHMAPDELRPRDVGQFLDVTKGKIQRNRQVAVLSAIYSKAVGRWYVAERNPCEKVERNPSKRRDRYITNDEYMALYELAPPRIQIAMDLALLTGQRQGDILALRWEQVGDDGIKIQQGKTGKKLLIGMSPSLKAVLDRARRMPPDLPKEYVLRTRKMGRPYTSEGFRAVWQRVMKKALKGYTKGKNKFPPVLEKRFTFHDIRAKTVSDSETLDSAFERAGHTTMAMTRGVYDRNFRKVTPLK